MKHLLEYIWIDATDNLRSKIKIFSFGDQLELGDIPLWSFDGSSTGQASGNDSDVFIRPVRMYKNPFYRHMSSFLVMCDTLNKDMTPHYSNTRIICSNTLDRCTDKDCWFGIEQEYFLTLRS